MATTPGFVYSLQGHPAQHDKPQNVGHQRVILWPTDSQPCLTDLLLGVEHDLCWRLPISAAGDHRPEILGTLSVSDWVMPTELLSLQQLLPPGPVAMDVQDLNELVYAPGNTHGGATFVRMVDVGDIG